MATAVEVAVKRCGRCKEHKSLDAFGNDKRRIDGLYNYCKPCVSVHQKRQRQKRKDRDPHAFALAERFRHRKRKYGVGQGDYERMVAAQGGLCCLCGETPSDYLRVEHHHASGVVRGLACNSCNTMIGQVEKAICLGLLQRILGYTVPEWSPHGKES